MPNYSDSRDVSIQTQNAAKVAAELLQYVDKVPNDASTVADTFKYLHAEVMESTMTLIETHTPEAPVATSEAAAVQRVTDAFGGVPATPEGPLVGTGVPHADYLIRFGKFKGLTLGQINSAVGDDGKSGRSWIEWASKNLDNELTKQACLGFLAATR